MKPIVAAAIATVLLVAPMAHGQQRSPSEATQEEPYQPGIAEIMTLQQMRHIKLWFSGRAGNWALADYEIGELKDGFEDVGKLIGGDLVDQQVGQPLAALEKAIAAKDRDAFTAAFDGLSAGCNSCHRTLDHAFIAIRRPTALPYTDQSFAPRN